MSAAVDSLPRTASLQREAGTISVVRSQNGMRASLLGVFWIAGDSARMERKRYACDPPFTLWIDRSAVDLRDEGEAIAVCDALGIAMPDAHEGGGA